MAADISPEETSRVESLLWKRMDFDHHLERDDIGLFVEGNRCRHSDPLAIAQLFIAYHLLNEAAGGGEGRSRRCWRGWPSRPSRWGGTRGRRRQADLPAGDPPAPPAIVELRASGVFGPVPIELVTGPDEYLFGEEKALLEAVEGSDPLPRIFPPCRVGLFAQPEGFIAYESTDIIRATLQFARFSLDRVVCAVPGV